MEHEQYFKNIDIAEFGKIRDELCNSAIVRYLYSLYHPNSAYMHLVEGTIGDSHGAYLNRQMFEESLFNTLWAYERQITSKMGIYGDIQGSNKTTNMIRYITSEDGDSLVGKPVAYPCIRSNYMTTAQKMQHYRWFESRMAQVSDIASTTLYVIPKKCESKTRKIVKRLGLQSQFQWIMTPIDLQKTTWNSYSTHKVTCISWNLWNAFVDHVDSMRFAETDGYGFKRVVFDQLEAIWAPKNEVQHFYMVPCQFTWFIDSSFIKIFEHMYNNLLIPSDYSRYIYRNIDNYNDYRDNLVRHNIGCLIRIYANELTVRRDNIHFDALRDSIEVTKDSYDSGCYPDNLDFHVTMREKTDIAKNDHYLNLCTSSYIHEKIRELIAKHMFSRYDEKTFKFGDDILHTSLYSPYYTEDEPCIQSHGWIFDSIKEMIHGFVYIENNHSHGALETGIFINKWSNLINYLCKRFSTIVDSVRAHEYYKCPSERTIFNMMHNYLYTGNEQELFNIFNRIYTTYPNTKSLIEYNKKYDNHLVSYYEKLHIRENEDSKLDIAHTRHRTYRINQNLENKCCSICMDDLSGPLFISGCCQAIYHCSCLFNSWDARYQHQMLTQCPNCRSDPTTNVHTKYISNLDDDVLTATVPYSLEQQLGNIFYSIYKENKKATVLWLCTPEIFLSVSQLQIRKMMYMHETMKHTCVDDDGFKVDYVDISCEDDAGITIPRIDFTVRKPVSTARRNTMQVYVLCKFTSYSVDKKSKVWSTLGEYLNTIEFDAIVQNIHIPYHSINLYNEIYTKKIPVYSLEHKRY